MTQPDDHPGLNQLDGLLGSLFLVPVRIAGHRSRALS
jgi:hypothetical protein